VGAGVASGSRPSRARVRLEQCLETTRTRCSRPIGVPRAHISVAYSLQGLVFDTMQIEHAAHEPWQADEPVQRVAPTAGTDINSIHNLLTSVQVTSTAALWSNLAPPHVVRTSQHSGPVAASVSNITVAITVATLATARRHARYESIASGAAARAMLTAAAGTHS